MRLLISIGLVLVSSSGAYSQHRGGFSPVVAPPVVRTAPPICIRPPAQPWGVQQQFGARPPVGWWRHNRFNRVNGAIIPYVVPYPIFTGDGYASEMPYPPYPYEQMQPQPQQQPPPPVTVVMPPQQSAPPATINQYVPDADPAPPPENSSVQVYQVPASPRPEPAEPPRPAFFIALKDGWVYTTSQYWVESGTLHYITAQGTHNQVSLNLVDRQTSARLNRGRDFQLPPP